MQLTGAQIVIECLKEQSVDTVFGYPGGTILNVYTALITRVMLYVIKCKMPCGRLQFKARLTRTTLSVPYSLASNNSWMI